MQSTVLHDCLDLASPATISYHHHPYNKNTVHTYQCPEKGCGKQFNRKYTLAEHLKTHTGEKPHVCPIRSCGKRFSTTGNLSRHKRLHGAIFHFECPVDGCNATYTNEVRLQKHLRLHFGNPVQLCLIAGCGKTFSTVGNLNRHLRNHHTPQERAQLDSSSSSNTEKDMTHSLQPHSPTAVEGLNDHLVDLGDNYGVEPIAWLAPPSEDENIWTDEMLNVLASMLLTPQTQ